jgi:hypothetical protein
MKNKRYLLILPLCALFLFNGKKYDESVIERIHLNYMLVVLPVMGLKGKAELDLHLKVERVITFHLPWFNIKIKKKEALKVL